MRKTIFIALFLLLAAMPALAEEASAPVISEIAPQKAKVDEKVTIKGSHFNADKKKNIVRFGTVMADVSQASPDSLVVTVPKGSRVCGVTVEVNGQKSKEYKFYVLPYLEFSLADKNLNPGQKSKGVIRIHGSKNPWKIRVTNKYYEVIDLVGGNEQVVISSGGDDNRVDLEIMAKQNGNFSLVCKKIEELDESQAVAARNQATPTPTPLDGTPGSKSTATSSDSPAPEPTPTKIVVITRTPAASPTKSAASTRTPSPTPEKSTAAMNTPSPTPTKSEEPVQKPSPTPTKSVMQKPSPTPTKSVAQKPSPTPEESVAQKPSPTPEESVAQKPSPSPTKSVTQKPSPSPTKSVAQKPSPTPTKSVAQKPSPTPLESVAQKPSPTPEESVAHKPSPSPSASKTADSNTAGGKDKKAVLAYCEKLKGKINSLKTEIQKVQRQIENQKEIYGKKKGEEDVRKKEKILDIGDRGKKISKRISEIDRSLDELEKNPNDNKTRIEALKKERDKISAELKNLKAWKDSLASQYSKEVRALGKSLKALSDKRDSYQQQIKKLQDEYDSKLKSLIS
jgi:predicted  nucleic acid-binding Zn-ribbon protein